MSSAITKKPTSVSKSVVWVMFSNLLGRVFTLASAIITARLLFPEDFGLISMAATFSALIDVFRKMGMTAFIISKKDITEKQINTVHLFNIIIGIVFALVMILASPFAAALYKAPEIQKILFYSAISFFIASVSEIPKATLLKAMRQSLASKIEILEQFLRVCLIILFAFFGFKYLSFVIPVVIAGLVSLLIYLFVTKWKFSLAFEVPAFKEALIYSKSFLPKTLLHYLAYNSDYIIIGSILGAKLLGFYFFGFEKALMLTTITTGISCRVHLPLFAGIQSNAAKLKETVYSVIEKQCFAFYPILFLQIVLASESIRFIFGNRWDEAIFTYQMISLYSFGVVVTIIFHVLFDAVGKPQENLKYFIFATPFIIGAIYSGAVFASLPGVAVAAFTAHSLAIIFLFYRTSKVFKWPLREIYYRSARCFIPLAVQLPVILILKNQLHLLNFSNLAVLLIITPLSLVLYVIGSKYLLPDLYTSMLENNFKKIYAKLFFKTDSEELNNA